jgi:hypothetical protein
LRGNRHAITILVTIVECPSPSIYKLFTLANLAAARREVVLRAVGPAWGPVLGKVWPFIRSQPGL